ncbi:hypothetical protein P7C73_g6865, partial [Tremellales sp. Uapishka_1]
MPPPPATGRNVGTTRLTGSSDPQPATTTLQNAAQDPVERPRERWIPRYMDNDIRTPILSPNLPSTPSPASYRRGREGYYHGSGYRGENRGRGQGYRGGHADQGRRSSGDWGGGYGGAEHQGASPVGHGYRYNGGRGRPQRSSSSYTPSTGSDRYTPYYTRPSLSGRRDVTPPGGRIDNRYTWSPLRQYLPTPRGDRSRSPDRHRYDQRTSDRGYDNRYTQPYQYNPRALPLGRYQDRDMPRGSTSTRPLSYDNTPRHPPLQATHASASMTACPYGFTATTPSHLGQRQPPTGPRADCTSSLALVPPRPVQVPPGLPPRPPGPPPPG